MPVPRLPEDTGIMGSWSSDTSSSDNRMNDQLMRIDIEQYSQAGGERRPRLVLRLWKIPLPLRKGHLMSDLAKNIACLMTLL